MEFKESDCYKAALLICSSGSAILTELLRLSNYIPKTPKPLTHKDFIYINGI